MLNMTLNELVTEEQREGVMLDLAQRVIKRGIMDDSRVMERAKQTISEITNDRQRKTLPNVPEERGTVGEVKGNGSPKTL